MRSSKHKSLNRSAYSKATWTVNDFRGDLALGLWAQTPESSDPVDAMLQHVTDLVRDGGLNGPPYRPAAYAPLRKIKAIYYKAMQIDGRLLPTDDGFVIELSRHSSAGRENFTVAHEIGHTFFFEIVPWIKHRNLSFHYQDKEEETLCNIAACELLMPSHSITAVARDYAPSPISLLQIAHLYETSLAATVVRLTSIGVWNVKFILWESTETGLKARWFAQPGRTLDHSPLIEIENPEFSSILNTSITGEPTESGEWLCFDRRFKFCRISSIRLPNSTMVLSSIGNLGTGTKASARRRKGESSNVGLPIEYECKCNGTGTCLIERDGLTYGARCLASNHVRECA